MFKLLDSLETVKRNLSKEIIRKINSNFLVISFSKKTLGGKKVIDERKRSWIYKILNENKVKYQKIEFLNEFFVVGKIE
ncbi:MAG: hypothetical protein KKC26_07820 [Nanoarchaeota archaeon]|nr:hypothetical protein [Nanoarchaeota archaeon]